MNIKEKVKLRCLSAFNASNLLFQLTLKGRGREEDKRRGGEEEKKKAFKR